MQIIESIDGLSVGAIAPNIGAIIGAIKKPWGFTSNTSRINGGYQRSPNLIPENSKKR